MMHNHVGLCHVTGDKPLIFFILRSQLADLKVFKLDSCGCDCREKRERLRLARGNSAVTKCLGRRRRNIIGLFGTPSSSKSPWFESFSLWRLWLLSVLRQDWHCEVTLTATHCVLLCEVTIATWSLCPHNLEKLFIIRTLQLSLPLSFSPRSSRSGWSQVNLNLSSWLSRPGCLFTVSIQIHNIWFRKRSVVVELVPSISMEILGVKIIWERYSVQS